MTGPFTYLDTALLAIALLSGLLAMYRGITREVLSILSWVVAAGSAVYFVLHYKNEAAELARQLPGSPPTVVAQVIGGGVVFLIVLIIVHLITARISDTILDSRVGMIDRILGFAFGVARGFVLVVIPFMFYESFVPNPEQQYDWVKRSASLPYLKSTGETFKTVLQRVVPSSLTSPSGEQQG
jgi:membrane protein required for colicin V production